MTEPENYMPGVGIEMAVVIAVILLAYAVVLVRHGVKKWRAK